MEQNTFPTNYKVSRTIRYSLYLIAVNNGNSCKYKIVRNIGDVTLQDGARESPHDDGIDRPPGSAMNTWWSYCQ